MALHHHILPRAFFTIAALAAMAVAANDGLAQSRRGPSSPGRIAIENQRAVNLVEMKVISKGDNPSERVIARNLAPGKRVNVTFPPRSGCMFDVAGVFDDDSEMETTERNLCQDKVLRLVE